MKTHLTALLSVTLFAAASAAPAQAQCERQSRAVPETLTLQQQIFEVAAPPISAPAQQERTVWCCTPLTTYCCDEISRELCWDYDGVFFYSFDQCNLHCTVC